MAAKSAGYYQKGLSVHLLARFWIQHSLLGKCCLFDCGFGSDVAAVAEADDEVGPGSQSCVVDCMLVEGKGRRVRYYCQGYSVLGSGWVCVGNGEGSEIRLREWWRHSFRWRRSVKERKEGFESLGVHEEILSVETSIDCSAMVVVLGCDHFTSGTRGSD